MIIVKNPNCVIDNITNLLKHSIPDAEIDQNVGAELSYILPDSQSHLFPAVFEDLEARREELGIARYKFNPTCMNMHKRKIMNNLKFQLWGQHHNYGKLYFK